MLRIGIYPYENNENAYIKMQRSAIEDLGYETVDIRGNGMLHENIDVAIFNWNESVTGRSPLRTIYHLIQKMRQTVLLKKKDVYIVPVFHNKQPHDYNGLGRTASVFFTKFFYKRADRIIVLSEDSKKHLCKIINSDEVEKKAYVVPHENYIGVYSDAIDSIPHPDNEHFILQFIGLIRPYKNIDIIIEEARRCSDLDIIFRISGKPIDENYSKLIKNKASSISNVEYNPGFIPDEEIDSVIRKSDAQILPYDIKSSMNSGAAILAFSNARTVICPEISTLSDYDDNLYYSYYYGSIEEHLEQLENTIRRAFSDWETDRAKFYEKGDALFEAVKYQNSFEKVKEAYSKLFYSLEKN